MKFCFLNSESDTRDEKSIGYIPRSRRSPSIVTRSVAARRSSESMRQQRSMSDDRRQSSASIITPYLWSHLSFSS